MGKMGDMPESYETWGIWPSIDPWALVPKISGIGRAARWVILTGLKRPQTSFLTKNDVFGSENIIFC